MQWKSYFTEQNLPLTSSVICVHIRVNFPYGKELNPASACCHFIFNDCQNSVSTQKIQDLIQLPNFNSRLYNQTIQVKLAVDFNVFSGSNLVGKLVRMPFLLQVISATVNHQNRKEQRVSTPRTPKHNSLKHNKPWCTHRCLPTDKVRCLRSSQSTVSLARYHILCLVSYIIDAQASSVRVVSWEMFGV